MEAVTETSQDVRMIPVDEIDIPRDHSRMRTAKNNDGISELTESIKATGGVIQPIIVLPVNGRYKIVAGARRLEATKGAGFKTIQASVLPENIDQETLKLITVTENLQREDLTPLEQAGDIKKLILAGNDVRNIAAKLGKSVSWVSRRANLNNLTKNWTQEIESGNNLKNWTIGHYELVARFDPDIQESILKQVKASYFTRYQDYKDFESLIGDYMFLLRRARWKLDDDTLLPEVGACTACNKRSSRNPELFEDDLTEDKIRANDRCLDADCWARKTRRFLENLLKEKCEEHPNLVKLRKDPYGGIPKGMEKIFRGAKSDWNYEPSKKSDDDSVMAIVVDGKGAGTMKWVKPRVDKVESDTTGETSRDPDDPRTKLENRKRKHWGRRYSMILQAIQQRLDDTEFNELSCDGDEHAKPLPMGKSYPLPNKIFKDERGVMRLIALGAVIGTNNRSSGSWAKVWDLFEEIINFPKPGDVLLMLWQNIVPVLSERLRHHNGEQATLAIEDAKRMCEVLEIDYETLEKTAIDELPDPKSWAKLEKEIEKGE
jgi:ParB/RepB/Spo0J family partition protein